VLLSLLNNAAKYTEPGGRIWVAANVVRSFRDRAESDDLVISVRDSGVGISKTMLSNIFDMFAQADRAAADRSQGGLGIGLELVRGLVQLHGGSVSAHSGGPGQGSEFVVRLPLCRAATEVASPSLSGACAAQAKSARRRVLVVDDNVDGACSLEKLLNMLGHQVAVSHDGPACLEKSRTFKPEVVILDIGLPGINGYEVGRRLRKMPALRKVLLIAMTGWGSDEDRQRSMEAGFNAHLVKPVELRDLESLLACPHF
jgi:CheY-like chemotaxis protein